jgi:hypothetical protein
MTLWVEGTANAARRCRPRRMESFCRLSVLFGHGQPATLADLSHGALSEDAVTENIRACPSKRYGCSKANHIFIKSEALLQTPQDPS